MCKRFFVEQESPVEKWAHSTWRSRFDNEAKMVLWHGKQIDLSPKEFSLLRTAHAKRGKTLSTETLLNQVWGSDFSGDVENCCGAHSLAQTKIGSGSKKSAVVENRSSIWIQVDPPGEKSI